MTSFCTSDYKCIFGKNLQTLNKIPTNGLTKGEHHWRQQLQQTNACYIANYQVRQSHRWLKYVYELMHNAFWIESSAHIHACVCMFGRD